MAFFKYLTNILQHSNLNGWFNEDSKNKIANIFSWNFGNFYCSYGDINANSL